MIKLHTWLPLMPNAIFEGLRPDAGHSSMEIITDSGAQLAYVSYWPEQESFLGEITQLMKPRPRRHPSTYSQEIDPTIGYMQRPSDYVDDVMGLDEEAMTELWSAIEDTKYDLRHWNCSNVSRALILCSFDTVHQKQLLDASGCSPKENAKIAQIKDPLEKLRYLATSQFVDCCPEDVRRMLDVSEKLRLTQISTS